MKKLLCQRVHYTEYKPETYQGISVTDNEGKKVLEVNTGNFFEDYNTLQDIYRAKGYYGENSNVEIYNSSSIDDFENDRQAVAEIERYMSDDMDHEQIQAHVDHLKYLKSVPEYEPFQDRIESMLAEFDEDDKSIAERYERDRQNGNW